MSSNRASKAWDMISVLGRGGPGLCNIAVTNACNAACDFCNFARGKIRRADLCWIDSARFEGALNILYSRDIRQQQDKLQLPNDNLDTGETTSSAEYRLTDETYADLLGRVSGKPGSNALRQDILSYYSDLEKPYATKRNPEKWEELIRRLDELKSTLHS